MRKAGELGPQRSQMLLLTRWALDPDVRGILSRRGPPVRGGCTYEEGGPFDSGSAQVHRVAQAQD